MYRCIRTRIHIGEIRHDRFFFFFYSFLFSKHETVRSSLTVKQKLTRFKLGTGKTYQERGTKKRSGMKREGTRGQEKEVEGRRERKNEYILGGLRDDLRIALLSSLLLASASPTWQFSL